MAGTEQKTELENQRVMSGPRLSQPLPRRLYTLKDAAPYLGRTLWGIRELVWAGKLPIVRTGKRQFVDVKDMERFIDVNKVTYL